MNVPGRLIKLSLQLNRIRPNCLEAAGNHSLLLIELNELVVVHCSIRTDQGCVLEEWSFNARSVFLNWGLTVPHSVRGSLLIMPCIGPSDRISSGDFPARTFQPFIRSSPWHWSGEGVILLVRSDWLLNSPRDPTFRSFSDGRIGLMVGREAPCAVCWLRQSE